MRAEQDQVCLAGQWYICLFSTLAVLHKYGVGETLQCKVMAVYSRHSHRQRDILSWSHTMMTLSLHPSWTHPHSDKHAF